MPEKKRLRFRTDGENRDREIRKEIQRDINTETKSVKESQT